MNLSLSVRAIIAQVEALSQRPVVIQQDPNLNEISTITTARGSAPSHLLSYKQEGDLLDYTIAYQLGFLVRSFTLPQEERWDIKSTIKETDLAIKTLELESLPNHVQQTMVKSIIIQLRSCAIGLNIDTWIEANFPELRAAQIKSAQNQLQENQQALSPEIRKMYPKPLLDANSAMNAAYAQYWAEKLEQTSITLPYKALGYSALGTSLYNVYQDTGDAPSNDQTLIELWGELLGLTGTFHFSPYLLNN